MRNRGTAVVYRNGSVLLVRDRGKRNFSLPGGGIKRNEPALSAAARELYEELGMRATKAERIFSCDYKGSFTEHYVSLIETDDEPRIRSIELVDFIWWDGKEKIQRYKHVDCILEKL